MQILDPIVSTKCRRIKTRSNIPTRPGLHGSVTVQTWRAPSGASYVTVHSAGRLIAVRTAAEQRKLESEYSR